MKQVQRLNCDESVQELSLHQGFFLDEDALSAEMPCRNKMKSALRRFYKIRSDEEATKCSYEENHGSLGFVLNVISSFGLTVVSRSACLLPIVQLSV